MASWPAADGVKWLIAATVGLAQHRLPETGLARWRPVRRGQGVHRHGCTGAPRGTEISELVGAAASASAGQRWQHTERLPVNWEHTTSRCGVVRIWGAIITRLLP